MCCLGSKIKDFNFFLCWSCSGSTFNQNIIKLLDEKPCIYLKCFGKKNGEQFKTIAIMFYFDRVFTDVIVKSTSS